MKTKQISMLAFVLATGGTMFVSCKGGGDSQAQQGAQAPALAVMTVTESDSELETGFPATLEGTNDVEIRPQISGFLTKVHVDDGQYVTKGQVLFTIDQVQLQAAVEQAEAAVQVAKANVNTATTNANNNKILLDKNIISASAYQTSADALNAAKAQLLQAEASLTSAKKNLSYSVVTAPTNGYVGELPYKEGALVSPSTLLTQLSGNSVIQAVFSINEKELLQFNSEGKRTVKETVASFPEVTLRLADGSIYPYKGKVTSIAGVINSATGAAQTKADFPNPDGLLRSGNTGVVLIPSIHNGTIKIPQNATFEIQDMRFVYVVGDSAKIHSTPITVAPENDGKSFIVTSGLKQGDVIVTEGVGIVAKDGMIINPKTGAAPQPVSEQAQ